MTSTIKSLLLKRFESVVKNFVAPALAREGFDRRRLWFFANQGEVSWIVTVQKSRWNDSSQLEFTIDCGVHVPRVIEIYNDMPPRHPSGAPDCCLSVRPAMLVDGRDKWWKLSADDAKHVDKQVGEEVQQVLTAQGLPFLYRFGGIRDVIEFLSAPRRGNERFVWPQSKQILAAYKAILLWLRGDRTLADKALDEALSGEKKAPIDEHLRLLRRRLSASC